MFHVMIVCAEGAGGFQTGGVGVGTGFEGVPGGRGRRSGGRWPVRLRFGVTVVGRLAWKLGGDAIGVGGGLLMRV